MSKTTYAPPTHHVEEHPTAEETLVEDVEHVADHLYRIHRELVAGKVILLAILAVSIYRAVAGS
jgi:hypothetical protein